ncbi:hypothetical protein I3843_10G033000 [Carya illinoinensis]|uniref:HSF-type DNA-binding domain-containing protein n=2 Tax=Carya illinoinensis TaxID=32201 RepID=A0A922DU30_CARIL|nr:heat stress transcription factor B-3-like [Carya illinoinensis]KAG2683515.1 hypothetical protein I3760_10G033500 [Carya illinoinensis]KAG6690868.1 hypothetical protein I3842_10G033600 [Carya illinoinensis]KAG7958754.1 hypothetical protein I3843_10G033000 [Carya illinoinensis]
MMEGGMCEKGLLMEYVRKSSPPPFLLKTYVLVEDPATDEVISWNTEGTAFVVWQPAEFARDILPTLFKHSNFSSFVRQLNTYGFRKIATNRWEFYNDLFRKGEKELLCNIRRRKPWVNKQILQEVTPNQDHVDYCEEDQRSSSTSSSSGYGTLIDENKRLKKENVDLNSELKSMKKKCKELLDLVAKYANSEKEDDERVPKLFGVRLLEVQGDKRREMMKRKSAEISESASILLSQSCK